MTSGTYGRTSNGSSSSAALQKSLESKLRALTQGHGSILFKMTWKEWLTPSGRSRSRLRASVLGTSVTACTGWPTPMVNNVRGPQKGPNREGGMCLGMCAALSAWPTPSSTIVDAKPRPPITSGRKPTDPQIGLADIAVHLTGSHAATESIGQLNPALPRWLMDLPEAWDRSAPYSSEWQSWQDLLQRATSAPEQTDMAACTDMAMPSMPALPKHS